VGDVKDLDIRSRAAIGTANLVVVRSARSAAPAFRVDGNKHPAFAAALMFGPQARMLTGSMTPFAVFYDRVLYDRNGDYNPTNGWFVAKIAGAYEFSASLFFQVGTSSLGPAARISLVRQVAGVPVERCDGFNFFATGPSARICGVQVTGAFNLQQGDVVYALVTLDLQPSTVLGPMPDTGGYTSLFTGRLV
jgi:hypothetical protein